MNCTIYTDGGSLNNPGQAAYAFVIYFDDTLEYQIGVPIGIATNNIAEYTGLIKALEKLKEYKKSHIIDQIFVYADSELMIKQLNGLYKVKNGELQMKVLAIKSLEMELAIPIRYTHVLREKNKLADSLVKKALGR